MVPGTIGALELPDWNFFLRNSKKHTTWVIRKDSKATTYWNRCSCFWFASTVSILTRFKSIVRDIVSTNNVQNDSSIFVILTMRILLCIAVSIYNLTFSKPSHTKTFTDTYLSSHAFSLQCLCGSLSFGCQRKVSENQTGNAHVFVTVCPSNGLRFSSFSSLQTMKACDKSPASCRLQETWLAI